MDNITELTDLDLGGKSSNFGGGLELLMNNNIKENKSGGIDVNFEDLNNLENELNDLSDDHPTNSYKSKSDIFSNSHNVSFDETSNIKLNMSDDIGKNTSQTDNDNKTWDGYGKFNNIPLNPDANVPLEPKLSNAETLKEKFSVLRKLEALEKKGIELSKKY